MVLVLYCCVSVNKVFVVFGCRDVVLVINVFVFGGDLSWVLVFSLGNLMMGLILSDISVFFLCWMCFVSNVL